MKFNFSFLSLLATLSLRDFIVQSFEYETTEFTSAVFNYSYTKDNKRYIAATEAIDFYRVSEVYWHKSILFDTR